MVLAVVLELPNIAPATQAIKIYGIVFLILTSISNLCC